MASSSTSRDPVEQLAEEFLQRRRQGQSPTVSEYAERHPEWSARIHDLFPVLLMLEEMKPRFSPPDEREPALVPLQSGRVPPRIGDYRLLREIGRGGMGVVYEAEQESLGRRVALKVLPMGCLSSPTRLRRFRREARAAARLHHTNIVPIFGVGHQDDLYYYVMQFISGQGLDRLFDASEINPATFLTGPRSSPTASSDRRLPCPPTVITTTASPAGPAAQLSPPPADAGAAPQLPVKPVAPRVLAADHWRTVAGIGVQVAEALHYAHQHGILHRDIKPANLLLDTGGTVWVADFGLAKLADLDDLTRSGDIVGTLRYMAPEQFSGQSDARSDVYSLGLTMYELLALRPAFNETDRAGLIRQVTQEEPLRLRKLNPAIPRDLETIVTKAIAASPDHRYQTAGELAADLKRFLEDRPIHARRITWAGRAVRAVRNRAVAVLAGTAATLLLAVAVVASIGYLSTSQALTRVSIEREQAETARQQAETERARTKAEHGRAEANLRLATKAFEEIFGKIASDPAAQPSNQDDDQDWPAPTSGMAVTGKEAALLESMLKFYDQFSQQNDADVKLQRETVRACRRIGDIQRRLGQYEKAETAYQRALAGYQRLADASPEKTDYLNAIAAVHNERGVLLRTTGQFPDARNAHLQALETLRKHSPQTTTLPESRFELATTYSYLSSMPWSHGPRRGGPPGGRHGLRPSPYRGGREAAENNRLALEILQKLAEEEPDNPRYRLAAARSQRDRYLISAYGSDKEEAEKAKQEAIDILKRLVEEAPHNPDYRYELAQTYATVPHSRDGRTAPGAIEQLRSSVTLGSELAARYPMVPEYKASLARSYARLSEASRSASLLSEAHEQCTKAVELQRSLVTEFPAVVSYRFFLGRSLYQRAEIQTALHKPAEARKSLEEAIAISQKIQETDSVSPHARMIVAIQYSALAEVLRELGEDKLADQAAAKARDAAPVVGR